MEVVAIIPALLGGAGEGAFLLEDICGKPVLGHLLDRLALSARIDGIVVATTLEAVNDPIASYCEARETACFRGTVDAENRLGLVLAALKSSGARGGAVAGACCPLLDPAILDHVVNLLKMTDGMLDFVGNNLTQTYPGGMEAEAFTIAALEDADRRCADPALRREATRYLRQNSRLYRLLGVNAEGDLGRPDLKLAVRGEIDLARIASILGHFEGRPDYSLREIIAFLDGRT